jgi:hypothetical protein
MDFTNSFTGSLYQWNAQYVYGFVRITDTFGISEDLFLHLAQIASGKPEINSHVKLIGDALVQGKNVRPALSAIITSIATSFSEAN